MLKRMLIVVCVVVSLGLGLGSVQAGLPQGTMFTYQGRLNLGEDAVNEACEFHFAVYEQMEGGTAIATYGSPESPIAVEVANGLFTTKVDFGSLAFSGEERWLEISVRTAGSTAEFTTLAPRQLIGTTPYALHAMKGGDVSSLEQGYNKGGPGVGRVITANAGPLSIEGTDGLVVAGRVGIGTQTPQAALDVAGMIKTLEGITFADGSVLTSAVGQDQLGGGGFCNNVFCIDQNSGNVGLGTQDPEEKLHVVGNGLFEGTVYAHGFSSASPLDLMVDGTTVIYGDDQPATFGFIRIGPATANAGPYAALQVNGDGNTETGQLALVDAASTSGLTTALAGISGFGSEISGGTSGRMWFIGSIGNGTRDLAVFNDRNGAIRLGTNGRDSDIYIDNGGDVGIGNDSPQDMLDVSGRVRANRFKSTTIAQPPLEVDSDMLVTNLNADLLDGLHSSDFWQVGDPVDADTLDGLDSTDFILVGALIDADTLDGMDSTAFVKVADLLVRILAIDGPGSGIDSDTVDGKHAAQFVLLTQLLNEIKNVDGSGSGIDADLLDGNDSAAFVLDSELAGILNAYALLAGRPGGQILHGGSQAGDPLVLDSNSTVAKGEVLINPAGGNVGIGTDMPMANLHVMGDVLADMGTVFADAFSSNSPLDLQTGGITRIYVPDVGFNAGFVGINTLAPEFMLDVADGSIHSTDSVIAPLMLGGTGGGDDLVLESTSNAAKGEIILAPGSGNVGIGTALGTKKFHVLGDAQITGSLMTNFVANNTNLPLELRVDGTAYLHVHRDVPTAGFVGINTTTPQFQLDVNGSIHTNQQLRSSVANGTPPIVVNSMTLVPNLNVEKVGGFTADAFVLLAGRNNEQRVHGGTLPNGRLILDSTADFNKGNVYLSPDGGRVGIGIGLAAPDQLLHVGGNGKFNGTVFAGAFSSNSPLQLQTAGVTRIYVNDNTAADGNVGIGNTAPQTKLHISDPNNVSLRLEFDVADTGVRRGSIQFNSGNGGASNTVGRIVVDEANSHAMDLNPTETAHVRMVLGGGKVGVGVTDPGLGNPMVRLDVDGSIRSNKQLISTVPNGTPPLAVESMDLVVNLNADKLDGIHGVDYALDSEVFDIVLMEDGPGSGLNADLFDDLDSSVFALLPGRPAGQVLHGGSVGGQDLGLEGNTAGNGKILMNLLGGDVGIGVAMPQARLHVAGSIKADNQLISMIPDGTPPLIVSSMTVVTNLNADKVDGRHENEFALLAGRPGGQVLNGGAADGEMLTLVGTSTGTGAVKLNPNGGNVGIGLGANNPAENLHVNGNIRTDGKFLGNELSSLPGSDLTLSTDMIPRVTVDIDTGNVGIGTDDPTCKLEVAGCLKADQIISCADSTLAASPLAMIKPNPSSLLLLPNVFGVMLIDPQSTGNFPVLLPVDVPTQVFGTGQKLKSIRVCYKVSPSTSKIDKTRVHVTADNGTSVAIVDDDTDRTSMAYDCYTVNLVSPAAIDGPLFIEFLCSFAGSSASHNIEFSRVELTLTEDCDGQ